MQSAPLAATSAPTGARVVDEPKVAPPSPVTEAAPTVDVRDLPRVASAQPASSAPSPASARPSNSDLTAERSLLDVARTALGRGDFANALVSADAHQKRFPKGALAEEREALAVQALAGAGRRDEARARAERFAKSFPGSILLPAVEAAGGVK
jgi:TolA-binding protein